MSGKQDPAVAAADPARQEFQRMIDEFEQMHADIMPDSDEVLRRTNPNAWLGKRKLQLERDRQLGHQRDREVAERKTREEKKRKAMEGN